MLTSMSTLHRFWQWLTTYLAILRSQNKFYRLIFPISKAPPPVFTCGTCHHLLSVKICKLDKNGNAGRSFTCCYKKHDNRAYCAFFAWVDARLSPPTSRFASLLPPCEPFPILPMTLPSEPPTPAPFATSNQSNPLLPLTSGFCKNLIANWCAYILSVIAKCAISTVLRQGAVEWKAMLPQTRGNSGQYHHFQVYNHFLPHHHEKWWGVPQLQNSLWWICLQIHDMLCRWQLYSPNITQFNRLWRRSGGLLMQSVFKCLH